MTKTAPVRRVSLLTAWAWLDHLECADRTETRPVDRSLIGQVTTVDVVSPGAVPPDDTVVTDGFAVRSADILGASAYNPMELTLGEGAGGAGRQAMAVVSGSVFPDGFDCVLPVDRVERGAGRIEIFDAVPRGSGIARRGSVVAEGGRVLAAGTRLSASDIMLLGEVGCASVSVRRRPRVFLHVFGAKSGPDTSSAVLSAFVERDGADLVRPPTTGPDASVSLACRDTPDVLVLVGRSGWGNDDTAEAQIRAAGGAFDLHGLALRPGDSVGLGAVGGIPVVLLPGDPLSTWVAYDLLVARLLRRWSGLSPTRTGQGELRKLTRKISSPVGIAEWVPIVCEGIDMATPVAIPKTCSATVFGRADAFTLVPAESEGYAPGATITIHRWQS